MDYNLHTLLYDITAGHFKSKWLCKHGKHNYMLKTESKIQEEEIIEDGVIIKKHHRIWLPAFYKCHCCGKEIR